MASAASRLEQAGQAAFIVMCLALAGAAVQYITLARRGTAATVTAAAQTPEASQMAPGTQLTLPPEVVLGSAATVLLGLSSTCQYCDASLPFYQHLISSTSMIAEQVRFAVVSLQPQTTMEQYLTAHGLAIMTITSVAGSGIRLRATPTLLLVNKRGQVERTWEGLLSEAQQRDVQTALSELTKTR